MRLIIRDKNSNLLGTIGFDHGFVFFGETNPELEAAVKSLPQSGIPILAEKNNESETIYFHDSVFVNDLNALPVLRDYLKTCGYRVEDYHEETVDALTQKVNALEDCDERCDLLEKISTLSYLEQTALLRELA